MKKKIIASFLAIVMMCDGSVAYATEQREVERTQEVEMVSASEPEEINASEKSGMLDGAIYWSVENNVLTIANYGSSGDIPDYEKGEYAPWYMWRNSIEEVVIEAGITGIGEYNFYDMPGIERVIINSSELTSIGEHAFDKCTNLEEINLPSTLSDMGIYAFARCKNLNKISEDGFVTPELLTEIPEYAFAECGGITNVTFSKNVKNIGVSAFYNCGSLKTLDFEANSLTTIEDYAFAKSGLENVVIPDGIQTIEVCAFAECNSLRTFGIMEEKSLTYVGSGAFSGCSNMTGFYVMAGSYAETYASTQQNLAGICQIYKYMSNDRKTNYDIKLTGDTSYTGKEIKPEVVITLNDVRLHEGVHYTLSYSNNIEVGNNAKITITGINEFYGSMDEYFTITSFDFSEIAKVETIENQEYTGKDVQPDVIVTMNDVVLTKNKDYTVSYENNVEVGNKAKVIIIGIGKYTGTIEKYFTITAGFDKAQIAVKNQSYTGGKVQPKVTVTLAGINLVEGKDYTVSYENNIKVGNKAKVIVKGIGKYTGTLEKYFTITADLSKAQVTVKKQSYTGKKLQPKVTVVFDGTKLVEGKDYKVTYSNNKKIGKKAKVTVQGIGLYGGIIAKKFTIAPPKPKVKVSRKKLKISNYQKGADIYITYTAKVKGKKKSGKLLWQAKKYKAKKCVDLTQLVKKYKGGKITLTITMKVNSVESPSSKKVTVK